MNETPKDSPEPMDLRSMDVAGDNRAKLKQLLPTAFTETRNTKGELVEAIDFDRLKQALGEFSEVFDRRGQERYGMSWPGKRECMRIIQQPSVATLKPCREESVNFDTTENLFIEGDNLEVLKLLQKSYYGKVKMIYIDPPYNTGNDFIYPDNYSESLQTYLEYTGQVDSEGRKFGTNTETDGRFHSKWLNMIYTRLYLARNLLKEDGVVFISIDDQELHNLRRLCDEIFGEESFLVTLVWQRRQVPDSRNEDRASTDHEYVVSFKRQASKLKGNPIDKTKYSNPDNDPRGPWFSDNLTGIANQSERPNLHYDLVNPQTGIKYPPSPTRGWSCSPDTMARLIAEQRIIWPAKPEGRPRYKKYLNEVTRHETGFSSWLDVGQTTEGTRLIQELFKEKVFPFSKPATLLNTLIDQATEDKEGIILDFFAGSGTTAHAMLDLNKQDGGNRKFILVQLPEPTGREDYPTIADIGKERIRRVIKKIEEERKANSKQGLFDSEDKPLDLGFKVFKLDKSNFKVWDKISPDTPIEEIEKQIELHMEHISPSAGQEEILYELLLKSGFTLTEKLKKLKLAGKTVYAISDGTLLICLEEEITKELIDAMAEADPIQVILLDKGFKGNDQLKANAVQTFKYRRADKGKEDQIIFRTV